MKTLVNILLAGVSMAIAAGKWTGGKIGSGVSGLNSLGHSVWAGLFGGGGNYIPTPAEKAAAEGEETVRHDPPELPKTLDLDDAEQLIEAEKIKTFVCSPDSSQRSQAFRALRSQTHQKFATDLFRDQKAIVAAIEPSQLASHLSSKAIVPGLPLMMPMVAKIPVSDLRPGPRSEAAKNVVGAGAGVTFTGVLPKKEPQIVLTDNPSPVRMDNVLQVDFRQRGINPELRDAMSNADQRYKAQADRRRGKKEETDDMQTVFEFKPRFAQKSKLPVMGYRH